MMNKSGQGSIADTLTRDVPKLQFIDFIHVPTNEAVQLSAQPHLGQEHNNLVFYLTRCKGTVTLGLWQYP